MLYAAKRASAEELLPLRARQREEMNCQIVHDSIHRREGWTRCYLLEWAGREVGFGSVAIAGPWKGKPTVFEFFLLPADRTHAFVLFEALVAASGTRFFEAQTNDALLTSMVLTYGRNIVSEKIVFRDGVTTECPCPGALLRLTTPGEELNRSIENRQGGGEWLLQVNGEQAGKGGILFHYNRPYGDIYMEINEDLRRRGLGSFLVQELKRECYALGAIPCARCSPDNIASRRTLVRAGFVPCAHILNGAIRRIR